MKPKPEDFRIQRTIDGNFRVTRTDIYGDRHSHFKSRQLAKKVIHNVCIGKIPLNTSDYALESMYRLSDDENYRGKIQELLDTRKSKSKKFYMNPHKKKF